MTDKNALIRDMTALTSPGLVGSTIPGVQRPTPQSHPKGWEPGVKFSPDHMSMMVTTTATALNVQRDEKAWHGLVEELGMEIPDGFVVRLVEAKYDPAAWTRETEFIDDERVGDASTGRTKSPAVTRPVWRYKFAVEHSSQQVHVEDVASIIAEVSRMRRKRKTYTVKPAAVRAINVVYADPQAGKVALLGGTRELAMRVADCFDLLDDHLRDIAKIGRGATEGTWLDAGDSCEGFNNVATQKYTNDMTITQQVRAHRRFTFHGLDYLAGKFTKVTAATCGSNHSQVREGKDAIGPPDNDWGIEVLSQVQDAYSRNVDAFGHVSFAYPPAWRRTLTIMSGGVPIGLAHGDDFRGSDVKAVNSWWAGQTFGNQPVSTAKILTSGHFHTARMTEMTGGRLHVQAPTLDNGSDWFTQSTGEMSIPGLLVYSTTPDGWDDLRILRGTGRHWGLS